MRYLASKQSIHSLQTPYHHHVFINGFCFLRWRAWNWKEKRHKGKESGQRLLREDIRSLQNNPEALISTSMHSFTQSQAPSACLGKERNAFILITYMSSLGGLNCMCRWPRQSACNVCTTSLHLLHLTSHPAHTFWNANRNTKKINNVKYFKKKKGQQTLVSKQWELCWR